MATRSMSSPNQTVEVRGSSLRRFSFASFFSKPGNCSSRVLQSGAAERFGGNFTALFNDDDGKPTKAIRFSVLLERRLFPCLALKMRKEPSIQSSC